MPEKRMLSEAEFAREYFKYFGPLKGMHLLSYALLMLTFGMQTAKEMKAELDRRLQEEDAPQLRSWQRALRDMREFGAHLEEQGYDWASDDEGRPLARWIVDSVTGKKVVPSDVTTPKPKPR